MFNSYTDASIILPQSLAILCVSAIISSITLNYSARVDASKFRNIPHRRISSCQGHDNSNTLRLNVSFSRARGKRREREREKERKKRKKYLNTYIYIYRRNCYGIPLEAIVNLRKVARRLQNCLVNPRWVTRALHKKKWKIRSPGLRFRS